MRPVAPLPQAPLADRIVLVVEDSQVQREHTVALVAALKARAVFSAQDGIEGLSCMDLHPEIDLVITDLEMPVMDGIRFIGEFAARGYRPDLIVLSSKDMTVLHSVGLMAETYGLVVPGVLNKPVNEERLRQLLLTPPLQGRGGGNANIQLGQEDIARGIRSKEFVCYYQPQVTLGGAMLKGVESLVRWRHPQHGLLGPAAFLPQAESNQELISDLTEAILVSVGDHWHTWRQKGLNLAISINLSALSLSLSGYADRLWELCQRLDLSPKNVIFEVTESASFANLGRCLETLNRLRLRGFRLSVDDFGTGFATFEQLERIPFTELKIDQSLIRDLPHVERNTILTRNMLQMARELNLATVAEGVETLEAWTALRAMSCELAQGYLIARPMPAEQLLEWVRQDRSHLRH